MCGPQNETETVKDRYESQMTDGTEETCTEPEEIPWRGVAENFEKETISSIHSVESGVAFRTKTVACSCKRFIRISS